MMSAEDAADGASLVAGPVRCGVMRRTASRARRGVHGSACSGRSGCRHTLARRARPSHAGRRWWAGSEMPERRFRASEVRRRADLQALRLRRPHSGKGEARAGPHPNCGQARRAVTAALRDAVPKGRWTGRSGARHPEWQGASPVQRLIRHALAQPDGQVRCGRHSVHVASGLIWAGATACTACPPETICRVRVG